MESITTVVFRSDETVTVSKKKKHRVIPPFYMIGNGTMSNKTQLRSIDLLEEAMSLTKAGQFVLRTIKNAMTQYDMNGVVYIPMLSFTSTQVTVFKKGYKELHDKQLAKRVRRSYYMINPDALIPGNYDEAVSIWNTSD